MRSFAAGLAGIAVLAGLAVAGGVAMGVWDPPRSSAVQSVSTSATTTASRADAQRLKKEKAGRHARPSNPRKRLNARDTRFARRAVVRSSDLLPVWRKNAAHAAPLSCRGNVLDLARFTLTGSASSGFHTAGGNAFISSYVLLLPDRTEAREYFGAVATPGALDCLRRDIAGRARKARNGSRVVGARMFTEPQIAEETAIYTVAVQFKNSLGQVGVYPVDVVIFQVSRCVGFVVFENVTNDKLELAHSVVGRLFRVNES